MPVRRSVGASLVWVVATAAATSVLPAQERPWTVEDVMTLRSVGDVALSPTGDWVTYVVSHRDVEENENRADLWLSWVEGGEPVRLTRQGNSNRAPRWAPAGSWIAFLSDRDGDPQVFGIRPTGGEAWRVTDAPAGVASFAIAPSGDLIAYVARPSKTDQDAELEKWRGRPMVWDSAYATDWTYAWVARLRDGVAEAPERSSPDGYAVQSMVWSPDSRGLAWTAVGYADEESFGSRDRPTGLSREADVFVQDRPGAKPRAIETLPGSKSVVDWVDGLGLIVSGSSKGAGTFNRLLWSVDPAGSADPVPLTEGLDEHAGLVAVRSDALLVQASYRTGARLYRIPLAAGRPSGDPEVLTDDELYYAGFSSTLDGDRVAFVANGPATPPNVYVSAVSRFVPRRVSDVNPQLPELATGEQRVVRWRSAEGREPIEGVLTLPVGYRDGDRVPLLLVIHGGPSGNSANTFNPGGRYPIQVFAGLGYASLQPNYRGSTGYGERFRSLNRGHISEHDWVDVESGVDYLVAQGIADPDRLGIMGWSFGGHHTFWGITRTRRFKAASAGAGANDLISMYSQTDLPAFYHTYLGPKPWEDFDLYEERSAYRYVDRVTTPLLIQVGERDERVPAEQSIQFYEAMKAIGRAPTTLVLYPGEGHGIRDVALTRDVMERNVAWFQRWIPTRGNAESGGNPEGGG